MKRFAVLLATAVSLAAFGAHAQIASSGGPIDVTADSLEMVDAQKLAIWKGNVDAVQGDNRMLTDHLDVYFSGPPPGAAKAPPKPAAPAGAGGMGKDWGEVKTLVADGHVFFVSPQQTARGEHAVYEVTPDTVTLTGNVVVVQGQNVIRGDTMVIEVKTGHATVISDAKGVNKPTRVRGVFYSKPGTGPAAPAKPAAVAAPAKAAR